jgi:hypothetical protein
MLIYAIFRLLGAIGIWKRTVWAKNRLTDHQQQQKVLYVELERAHKSTAMACQTSGSWGPAKLSTSVHLCHYTMKIPPKYTLSSQK